jgi:transposase-like protein
LLNGIHHKRTNRDKALANGEARINGLDSCRGYGERRLSAYNGGFIRNDRLFIREMEFRFKHRNDENCLDYLREIPPNWSDQVT